MVREIKEIEESLTLCIEMDSPSVVIPVSEIEKHFPAPRIAIDPTKPCYNLSELKEWAGSKGWTIKFATTPSKNGKRILPAIRFIPLNKIYPEEDTTPKPTTNKTEAKHYWYNKPLGQIAIGVIVVVLGGVIFWVINHYLSINLQNIK